MDALATWLVPNKLSSTKFCQFIRPDSEDKSQFLLCTIVFLVVSPNSVLLTFKSRLSTGRASRRHLSVVTQRFSISVTTAEKESGYQSQSSLPRKLIGGKVYVSSPSWRETHNWKTVACFCVYFHKRHGFKAAMDAFLRGQSSAASSLKQKQQASEETAGPSTKRISVPWVEK